MSPRVLVIYLSLKFQENCCRPDGRQNMRLSLHPLASTDLDIWPFDF